MENTGEVKEVEEIEVEVVIPEVQDKDDPSKPMQQKQERPVRPRRKMKAPQYYGQVDDIEGQDEDEGTRSEEDDQEYRVKKILARHKGPNNKWEYLVQFTGYPPNEAMWRC